MPVTQRFPSLQVTNNYLSMLRIIIVFGVDAGIIICFLAMLLVDALVAGVHSQGVVSVLPPPPPKMHFMAIARGNVCFLPKSLPR